MGFDDRHVGNRAGVHAFGALRLKVHIGSGLEMIRWFNRTRRHLRRSLSEWFGSVQRRHTARMRTFNEWLSWLRRVEPSGNEVCRDFGTRGRIRAISFWNPIFWLTQLGGFVVRYFSSRGAINLFLSVPALCGLIGPIVLTLWVAPDSGALAARSASRMGYHRDRGEYEKAEFFSRRLCALRPEDEDAIFRRAEVLDLMDRDDEARYLLSNLAVERSYQPAWLLICQRDLMTVMNSNPLPEELSRTLEVNLQQLVARFPQNIEGRYMLATLYARLNRPIESLTLLETLTRTTSIPVPDAWYSQAVLQRQLGREEASRASANMAADQLMARNVERTATPQDLLRTMRALVIAYREPEALQLVDSRLAAADKDEDRQGWSSIKGEICAAWSQRLRARQNASAAEVGQSITILFEGIRAAPREPVVLDELSRLAISQSVSDEVVEQHLQTALNSGVSPGLVHFILGTRALTSTPPELEKADEHFQLALAHDAGFPGLLNNLADMIASSDGGDFQEALKIVDQALTLLPGQPEIHDTRGKLLVKLGEPLKALAEFELALREPAIRGEVNRNMAAAWRALGNHQKANECLQVAEALQRAEATR